jgi:hypothetical protein
MDQDAGSGDSELWLVKVLHLSEVRALSGAMAAQEKTASFSLYLLH